MKKILFLFVFLQIGLFVNSQVKYPLSKYPMHSSIWSMSYDTWMKDEDGKPLIVFSPKGYHTFENDCPGLKNVNLIKVQSLLITELNTFRKDYKKENIKESKTLSTKSIDDAKKLATVKNYKIVNENDIKIVYDRIPPDFFSRVDFKKFNIEKTIAESVFDWFVANDAGMGLLLSDQKKEFGVGVYVNETNGVTIVIRGK